MGLSLEIENGKGALLRVKAGQTFFVNQIDIRAAVGAMVDEEVSGLDAAGDFAALDWAGVALADEDFPVLPNPDGTFTRRRFFRDATWMTDRSDLVVQPVDAQGAPTGPGVTLDVGTDGKLRLEDDFFVRRMRAIQWTNDCRAPRDCAGARSYLEEALIELRNTRHPEKTFTITAATAALRVSWTERPGAWTVPVEAVVNPPYAYGFGIDVEALTPPGPSGAYAPGTAVAFRATLRDGAGNRLHPEGSLPSYSEVMFGPNHAGIQYHRAFFDPAAVYYRRKHRERTMVAQIIGPAQNIQPIRSIVELSTFLVPGDGPQTIGTQERDGVFAQAVFFPRADDLFGGAFDPTHAGWGEPVSDQWTYAIPPDAQPGTYLVTLKGSRSYLGEDTHVSRTIKIQVGTPQATAAQLDTGGCGSCHNGGGELSKVLHANDDRATCSTCHAPIGFEYEGPVAVRTHFIHSRSNRFDAPLTQCSSCHQTADSIARTSKAACLSCHKAYPADHVQNYGPVESMYVGGGRESFSACGEGCHATHPGSGL
ncbi:MAG TPA: hypothetical protein VFS43_10050 [Polyangiaceae bacterium]|nr:hypothetical protein [Polyangiaceae bacterium]